MRASVRSVTPHGFILHQISDENMLRVEWDCTSFLRQARFNYTHHGHDGPFDCALGKTPGAEVPQRQMHYGKNCPLII